MALDIPKIQSYLREHNLDGWLLADFHGYNRIAMNFLNVTGHITRRMFYLIPADGEPICLVNPIEGNLYKHLPGQLRPCFGYKKVEAALAEILKGKKRIAMEYSPLGRLPYIGMVDAGTIEMVSEHVAEIVSSADIFAEFEARLSVEQIALHKQAAEKVLLIKNQAFEFVTESLKCKNSITEYDIVRFVLRKFEENNMETDHAPICGVDGNAGNPHYEAIKGESAEIKYGQLLLLDLWAKLKKPKAVFADITWMAFCGKKEEIPQRLSDIFSTVAQARDAAVECLKSNFGKKPLYGADADDACRNVISQTQYARNFTHRTGHSIGIDIHGVGPNIDNLETEDRRILQSGHLFSIEPGIYLDDCGFRTEIDLLMTENGPEITTLPLQTEITALF
ncbi:MAG: aminopeptidase P family protein [candidate division Zixibacteria bacterium]|nr:aminopeptidase P family protein [candidate division Zixibacteria bacterium]